MQHILPRFTYGRLSFSGGHRQAIEEPAGAKWPELYEGARSASLTFSAHAKKGGAPEVDV